MTMPGAGGGFDVRSLVLGDFEAEMAVTRQVLACVATPDLAWTLHPRAMALGRLAAHIADIPRWTSSILRSDGYDASASSAPTGTVDDVAALRAAFERNVEAGRARLLAAAQDELLVPWVLRSAGRTLITLTRAQSVHVFVVNHVVHHRGQLIVALRLRGAPVAEPYDPAGGSHSRAVSGLGEHVADHLGLDTDLDR